MESGKSEQESTEPTEQGAELESIIQKAISEYMRQTAEEKEPALKAELAEERRRREDLEKRLGELAEENRRSRTQAEKADRFSQIRGGLQELGVKKIDVAFRAVKDDVLRSEDGRLYVESDDGRVPLKEHLAKFVSENPEFLPPRISGGSGATGSDRAEVSAGSFDLDRIRPGMSQEELAQAWKEVARLAGRGSSSW